MKYCNCKSMSGFKTKKYKFRMDIFRLLNRTVQQGFNY